MSNRNERKHKTFDAYLKGDTNCTVPSSNLKSRKDSNSFTVAALQHPQRYTCKSNNIHKEDNLKLSTTKI